MNSLEQLIEYDAWANQQIYKLITENGAGNFRNETIKLFSHIFAAQIVWISRINSEKVKVEIWPDWTLVQCEEYLNHNPSHLKKLLGREPEIINYQNSRGDKFANSVSEILHHIIIHGQHHRAQISMIYRKAGFEPPVTDFIFFLRQKHNSRKA
jgi:uncharacterized damage-inducible protein DinB